MNVKETVLEVLYGVLPISIIITILQFTLVKLPWDTYFDFLGGALLLLIGLTIFLLGVNIGFVPFGEALGNALVKTGKMRLILLFGVIIGFAVTIPEPDVQVLISQVAATTSSIDKTLLLIVLASGVGIFVALALLRIFLKIPVRYILIGGYALCLLLLLFCPSEIATIAFDAGGVTTGSLTVPFIMSLGVGVASVMAKKSSMSDSFGILAIASLGPVLSILLLGVLSG